MGKKLVIVESPAKARTIKGFLGPDYEVLASIGHIRDLAENKKELPSEHQKKWWADYSVDMENDFEPIYIVPDEKRAQVTKLRAAMKDAESLVLATDEDREGESISWHLLEVLKPKKGMTVQRIAFHEITKDAIRKALETPRQIDQDLVRAQEARRVLDRLFGYGISPVIWRISKGKRLSVGRVQTPAVKLVVEREIQRRNFQSSEYWDLKATLLAAKTPFEATLQAVEDRRLVSGKDDFDPATGQLKNKDKLHLDGPGANRLLEEVKEARPWTVTDVESHPEQRKPYPPFMTSTLQQEANRKLGFAAERTMRIAQDLYEGITGSGFEGGLITYMRTDSLNLSELAVRQSREWIEGEYGKEYLPAKPNRYTSKVNNAQEAHEAIRPTDVTRTPEMVRRGLGDKYSDHVKLYELIWKRTVASQMKPAELEITTVRIDLPTSAGRLTFGASGKAIKFAGFLRAYVEGSDDAESALEDQEKLLPELKVGQELEPKSVDAVQHITKPPARYTDASLVRALEERGIGRPSTYAAILKTIADRGYVRKQRRELVPTMLAFYITEFMNDEFEPLADLGFTAKMDDDLDEIANGKRDWKRYLKEFYYGGDGVVGLKPLVDQKESGVMAPTMHVGTHPETGESIDARLGPRGFYLVCGEATASVPEDIAPADLNVAKALELMAQKARGPQTLGVHPKTGRNLILIVSPKGTFVKAEQTEEEVAAKAKPDWVSVPPNTDPLTLTQEDWDQLCELPRNLGELDGEPVVAGIGRYGPYVAKGKDYRNVEDWRQLLTMSLNDAAALVAQPKTTRAGNSSKGAVIREFGDLEGAAGPVKILGGWYGPYVTDGKTNASLPKGTDPATLGPDEALALLAARRDAPPSARKGRTVKRKKK
jgi:DNA topoisomerase-1